MKPNDPFQPLTGGAADISHAYDHDISISAAVPSSYVDIGNMSTPYTLNETYILDKAKPHLYQSSEIVDMVMYEKVTDESILKENIRAGLRLQMAQNLTENMTFTRVNDYANDNMIIHGRCYAFTREQLLDFVREINK